MLHLVITKITTTTPYYSNVTKVQHNPPPKDVAFGYYQKYNNSPPLYTQKKNVTKKYNITHPLKMLYLAITKSTTTTTHPYLLRCRI